MFVFIGTEPHTSWLPPEVTRDDWGFIITGEESASHHAGLGLETSMAGVFAVGDVRHGSMKRVASAVGEGSICIPQIHTYLHRLARRARGPLEADPKHDKQMDICSDSIQDIL